MVRYEFIDAEKLPREGAVIVAPNHYSEIDPLVIGVAMWMLGRQPRFMAKESLFRLPLLGRLIRRSGQIPVSRNSSSHEAIRAAKELVEAGNILIVYPEGTLTRDPDLWPMRGKSGAVRVAIDHKIPLIPVAHWGVQELFPRYGKMLRPFPRKKVRIMFGDPIDLDVWDSSQQDKATLVSATEKLMNSIADMLGQLRDEQAPLTRWNPLTHNQKETGRFEK